MSEPVVLNGVEVPFGTITQQVGSVREDTDDTGPHPDLSVLNGLGVTLKPSRSAYVWTAPDGKVWTLNPIEIRAGYDPDTGRLRRVTATGFADEDDIRIPATEGPGIAVSWWYEVKWHRIDPGTGQQGEAFFPGGPLTIAAGATVDLASVILSSVVREPGRAYADLVAAATALQQKIDGAGQDALDAADRAEAARDETEAEVVAGLTWSGSVDLAELASAPRLLRARLTGNVRLLLPSPGTERAMTLTLVLAQDATGGRTFTIPGARAAWATAYVHTGTPNSVDVLHLMSDGAGWIALPAAQNVGTPTGWVV